MCVCVCCIWIRLNGGVITVLGEGGSHLENGKKKRVKPPFPVPWFWSKCRETLRVCSSTKNKEISDESMDFHELIMSAHGKGRRMPLWSSDTFPESIGFSCGYQSRIFHRCKELIKLLYNPLWLVNVRGGSKVLAWSVFQKKENWTFSKCYEENVRQFIN